MFRHHQQENVQVHLLNFQFSFECSVIKYKNAFNIISFISIIHTISQ